MKLCHKVKEHTVAKGAGHQSRQAAVVAVVVKAPYAKAVQVAWVLKRRRTQKGAKAMRNYLPFLFAWLAIIVFTAANYNIWGGATTDQQRCQAEANYMAARNIKRHVGPTIGNFEGIGWGSSPNCRTCTPRRGRMRLTGDAVARCANGYYVRVRSWR